MKKRRNRTYILSILLIAIIAAGTIPTVYADEVPAYSGELDSKSAVLMDADSGTVFFEKNPHEKLPPASVTKVMTMLLITEAVDNGRVSLDDVVTVSEKAASMGGSQMYMEPGETHTLDQLLTGIAMVSANDACVAAAEYISGSMDIFVEQMNSKAKDLGLENTHFSNTNGLPVSDHYTSAYDIAVMSSELIKHDVILPYLAASDCVMEVGKEGKPKTSLEMINTNKLLRTYSGAIGIKTGFTQDAGYCLSAAAKRDGLTLVAVVLGASSSKIRFDEAAQLLDYGFANYESVNIAEKNDLVGNATVDKGVYTFTDLQAQEDIKIIVPKGKGSEISFKIIPAEDLTAPVKEGDTAGRLVIMKKEKEIASFDLIAASSVPKAKLHTRVVRKIEGIFK